MTTQHLAIAFVLALAAGCFQKDNGPVGYPVPARQCTPEESQEAFDCGFYGFEFEGRKTHALAATEYTGAYVGGDKTMCGCKQRLLDYVDQTRAQNIEPIVKQPCRCTRKHS